MNPSRFLEHALQRGWRAALTSRSVRRLRLKREALGLVLVIVLFLEALKRGSENENDYENENENDPRWGGSNPAGRGDLKAFSVGVLEQGVGFVLEFAGVRLGLGVEGQPGTDDVLGAVLRYTGAVTHD